MYKVFINEKLICFTNNVELVKEFSNVLIVNFYHHEVIPFVIELIEKDKIVDAVFFNVNDVNAAFKDFQSFFKNIKAAGGIVFNQNQEILFIHRLQKWDLPKGKLEKDESVEDGAIREVMEECGVKNLNISKEIDPTYHIYHLKDKLILKQTYWFEMNTDYSEELIPQTEEGITKVVWLDGSKAKKEVLSNTYNSIKDLLLSSDLLG